MPFLPKFHSVFETQRIGWVQVNKVFRSLRSAQLRLGGRTPTIRFGTKVFDLVHSRLRPQKGRHICGQSAGRQPVNHAMALITPGARALGLHSDANQHSHNQGRS